MSRQASSRTIPGAFVVLAVAVLVRTPAKITIQPITLLLLAPLSLIFSSLIWISLDVFLTWWLELARSGSLKYDHEDRDFEEDGAATQYRTGRRLPLQTGKRRIIPPLSFTSSAAWSVTQTRASWEASNTSRPLPLSSAPQVASAVDELVTLVIRDFVLRWYSEISDSPTFPNAVEHTVREVLKRIAERMVKVDWSDLIVGRIVPLLTTHLETFKTTEHALRGLNLRTKLTESDELDLLFASRYAQELAMAKLHPAVDVTSPNARPSEEAWLRTLIDSILPYILPEKEAQSSAVSVMIREISVCAVIYPIVEMLSDPDTWNRIIDDKAGAAIRDQKMVTQFREALDRQGANLPSTVKASRTMTLRRMRADEISVRTDPKQFDSFVRDIGRFDSLLDVRRLRNDVSGQIRRTKLLVEGKRPEEVVNSFKVSELLDHIQRLAYALKKVDKRIAALGGNSSTIKGMQEGIEDSSVSLRQILMQPTSLSHFMEFQDRRKHAFRVQFWLLIEGLKDPLEDAASDSEDDGHAPLLSTSEIRTAHEDMKLVWETYFTSDTLQVHPKYIEVLKTFVEDSSTSKKSAQEIRKVRRAVFAAQQDVLQQMEDEDFLDFKRSELYFKAMAEFPRSQATDATEGHLPPKTPLPSTRPRSSSHPDPRPHPIKATTQSKRAASPAFDTVSPVSAEFTPTRPITTQRTETAPPQLTVQAVFDDRPASRRMVSSNSLDTLQARNSSAGSKDNSSRKNPMTDSLEFLMTPSGPLETNRSPLFNDEENEYFSRKDSFSNSNEHDYMQVQTIEAIQEALNSILATDAKTHHNRGSDLHDIAHDSAEQLTSSRRPSRKASLLYIKDLNSGFLPDVIVSDRVSSITSSNPQHEDRKHSRTVFDDGETLDLDEVEHEDRSPEFDPNTISLAAPGNLQLPAEIAHLGSQLEKLYSQEAVVGALIRKAELTGIASELRLLLRSRESLKREIRATEFQKSQYELQESENQITPGRTTVTIPGTTVGEASGQNFQLYILEVHQLAADGSYGSGWIVTRRYSEFSALHTCLKERYLAARSLEIPGKRLVTAYSDSFIEQRKTGLQKYIQSLIRIPIICQSPELRSFLSQQNISLPRIEVDTGKKAASVFPGQNLVRSFYRTVTSGIDDMLGVGSSSMMDTIIERLSQQAADISGLGQSGVQEEDLVGQILAEQRLGSDGISILRAGEEKLSYFTAPICDLFVALFELKEKNNWLRRQAVLIILQQILGGTIERKFRDGVKLLLVPDQLASYIQMLKNGLWPGGQIKPKLPARTTAERNETRLSANRKLAALMPDVAASLIGRANAKQGARRFFAVLQNRRLNSHLVYSIADELVAIMFPETRQTPVGRPLPGRPLFP